MTESKRGQNRINQMYVQACEGVWRGQEYQGCTYIKSSENSNFPRVDVFQDVVYKFEQSSFGRVKFVVRRLKRAVTGRNRYVGEKASKSELLQNFANCIKIRNGPEIERIRF